MFMADFAREMGRHGQLTATERAAFSSLPLHAQSLPVVAAPVSSAAPDEALPVIVVTAHRHS